MPAPRSIGKACAATLSLAMAISLAACGGKGNAHGASSTSASASGSSSSASAASGTSSTTAQAGPYDVYVYYYQQYPTRAAELAQMGLDSFSQAFTSKQLKVHVQAITDLSNLQQTLTNDQASALGNNSIAVCACPYMPAALTSTKGQGYPFVLSTNKQFNFYYSEIASLTPTTVAQPFWAAISDIANQAVGRGQGYVESELAQHFGESKTRADQTFDSLSGKPVNADVSDVQVTEVDFYPFLGWSPESEYMTQVVTVKNTTENAVSSLTFPLLPGARDVHSGLWGKGTPPYTGKALTADASGEVSVQTPIPPFQTVSLSVTYAVGATSGTQWPSFTWTLPFSAQTLKVLLFKYYATAGDTVQTSLPKMQGDSTVDVWGAQNMTAGQSISFTPSAPSHSILETLKPALAAAQG